MKNENSQPCNPVHDTQLHTEDIEPVRKTVGHHDPTWEEVEDATILLNPDADSMESRG